MTVLGFLAASSGSRSWLLRKLTVRAEAVVATVGLVKLEPIALFHTILPPHADQDVNGGAKRIR